MTEPGDGLHTLQSLKSIFVDDECFGLFRRTTLLAFASIEPDVTTAQLEQLGRIIDIVRRTSHPSIDSLNVGATLLVFSSCQERDRIAVPNFLSSWFEQWPDEPITRFCCGFQVNLDGSNIREMDPTDALESLLHREHVINPEDDTCEITWLENPSLAQRQMCLKLQTIPTWRRTIIVWTTDIPIDKRAERWFPMNTAPAVSCVPEDCLFAYRTNERSSVSTSNTLRPTTSKTTVSSEQELPLNCDTFVYMSQFLLPRDICSVARCCRTWYRHANRWKSALWRTSQHSVHTSWRTLNHSERILRIDETNIGCILPHSLGSNGMPVLWTGSLSREVPVWKKRHLVQFTHLAGFHLSADDLPFFEQWMTELSEEEQLHLQTTCRTMRVSFHLRSTMDTPRILEINKWLPNLTMLQIDLECIRGVDISETMATLARDVPQLSRLWIQQNRDYYSVFSTEALRELGKATQLECLVLDVQLELMATGFIIPDDDSEAENDEDQNGDEDEGYEDAFVDDQDEEHSGDHNDQSNHDGVTTTIQTIEEEAQVTGVMRALRQTERRVIVARRKDAQDFWHVLCSLPMISAPTAKMKDLSLGHGVKCCSSRGSSCMLPERVTRLMLDKAVRTCLDAHPCTERFSGLRIRSNQ